VLELEVVPEPYVVYSSGLSMTIIGHPTPWDQFVNVISMSYQSLRSIGYRVASKVGLTEKSSTLKPRNFSGPVGIGTMMFKTIYYGSFIQGIYLVVIITFSLGLLNLMPLPILDGGHILFSLIETVVGRPLPHKYLQPVNIAFIIFLVSFMLYVTVFDVGRLIPEESRNGTQNGQSNAPKNP
jgi:regulator of sigma E protease